MARVCARACLVYRELTLSVTRQSASNNACSLRALSKCANAPFDGLESTRDCPSTRDLPCFPCGCLALCEEPGFREWKLASMAASSGPLPHTQRCNTHRQMQFCAESNNRTGATRRERWVCNVARLCLLGIPLREEGSKVDASMPCEAI